MAARPVELKPIARDIMRLSNTGLFQLVRLLDIDTAQGLYEELRIRLDK